MKNFRLFDLLKRYSENFNNPNALVAKESGQWKSYSNTEFVEYANNISYGLLALGIQKNDKIAIISNNRPEWNFIDMGIMQTGAIDVPIYPTASESDLQFILNDAEVKYIFVSSQELYNKVKSIVSNVPSVKEIYSFNKLNGVKHWLELVELGRLSLTLSKGEGNPQHTAQTSSPLERSGEAILENIKLSINENDLATMLYTSGTTGNPKGVMLSHKNLFSNVYACRILCPLKDNAVALSFLPLNHVYERMLTYLYMYKGISIYYAESIETIGDNLKDVKPEMFSTVPRLLEKVYDKIVAKGNEQTGIKKTLFFWALDLGLRYEHYGKNGWWYEFQLSLANKIIFNKWREALGGNVKCIVSGGAALQPRLAMVFWAAKIPVLEGYGLTETSPVIAVNNFEENGVKFGTVGPLIEGEQVKIAEDGEILVKGDNIMLGYYKRPDATAEAIDADGWFHTGDIGVMEENRFLKITDRKKEIFKTSGGKYIAPQILENKLKESPFIEQVLVIGENQKFAAALVVPAFAALKDWCAKQNISYSNNSEMIKNEKIIKLIRDEIAKANAGLAQYETIKKFELLPTEWTIDKGEMTPKMSLKRKIILTANKELVEKIFG